MTVVEKKYLSEEIQNLKKPELVAIVKRQLEKWPKPSLSPWKIRVDTLRYYIVKAGFSYRADTDSYDVSNADNGTQLTPLDLTAQENFDINRLSPLTDLGSISSPALSVVDKSTSEMQVDVSSKPDVSRIIEESEKPQTLPRMALRLFIDEWRDSISPKQLVETINVCPIDQKFGSDGSSQWFVSASEVLIELQRSYSAIEGIVKVSVPDSIRPEYRQCFAKMTDGIALEDTITKPSILPVQDNSMISIVVEHIQPMVDKQMSGPNRNLVATTPAEFITQPAQQAEASHVHTGHSTAPAERKAQSTQQSEEVIHIGNTAPPIEPKTVSFQQTENETDWLRHRAAAQPGYDVFCRNQNRKLKNAARAEFWLFIGRFSRLYRRKRVGDTDKRVTKTAIMAALGICSSTLADAEKMTDILEVYGEGGPHPAQDVITKLQEEELLGSGLLSSFLTQWERDHPVPVE